MHLTDDAAVKECMRPRMRTFYNRYAFQIENSREVRITLDSDLCFVREEGMAASGGWRRDIRAADFPFSCVGSDDVRYFPGCILEVKTEDDTYPSWLDEVLMHSGVSGPESFSKFQFGTAALLTGCVPCIPPWFDPSQVLGKPPSELLGAPEPPTQTEPRRSINAAK